MNPASHSRSGHGEAPRAWRKVNTEHRQDTPDAPPSRTPDTDMQPEDAGTAASGNDQRATASQSVMKLEHGTDHETGRCR